jgi:hypothetical protein
MKLELSLRLQPELADLAGEALDLLAERPPRWLEGMFFEELLRLLHVRARPGGPSTTGGFRSETPATGGLFIAGAAAAAHSEWSGEGVDVVMQRSVARATERLASGMVPDQPERFSMPTALEHVREAAMEAALTRLGRVLRPPDEADLETEPDSLDQLLEVSSSGLAGAWIAERLPPE